MTYPTSNGIYDPSLGYIIPPNEGTWDELTTWDSFTQWAGVPANPLTWTTDIIDLGRVKTFNLKIIAVANGQVEYSIYTSNTGLFDGEETVTNISSGQSGIGGFTAQYVWIQAKVYSTGGVNTLQGLEYAITEGVNSMKLNDVDTSTLSGTSAARTLSLTKTIGSITNIQITPKTVPSYAVDLYVSNTPTSNTVIPRVISKTSTPQIALVGIDNQPRDAVVDIVIEYLPEGYMDGNNLLVR